MNAIRTHPLLRPLGVCLAIATGLALMSADPGGLGSMLWAFIEADRGPLAILLFGLAYLLGTLIFVPSPALACAAGLLFGGLAGSLIALSCRPIGALLAFWIGRYAGHDAVVRWTKRYPSFEGIHHRIQRRPFSVITTLRLVPIMPFNFLNYALGTTQVSTRTYFYATFLGSLPLTLIYVWIGAVAQN